MHVETATSDDKARGAKRPVTAIGAALIGAGVMSTLAAQAPLALSAPAPVTPRPTVISHDVKLAADKSAAAIPAGKWTYTTDANGKTYPVKRGYAVAPRIQAPAEGKTTDSGLTDIGYTAAEPKQVGKYSPNSIAYIPENIAQVVANIPAVEYQALNMTAEAFENSDNWWLYIPTNVVGFDQQDKQKFEGMTLAMVPVPLVAKANYDQWWLSLAANAPMTENCTGIPGPCSDVFYFDQYGTVPTWKLIDGYTFPEIKNTIDPDHDTYVTPNGRVVKIQPDWSGKTYKLDPFGPQKAIWQTLTQKPTGVQRAPTAGEWAKAFDRMGKAMWIGLNPNVDGTFCLPCQWAGTATGAPGSLPKQYLFGEYYTFFDFGQARTEHDWVVNRPDYDETAREDHIEVRNGLDPKDQRHLINEFNKATTPKALQESVAEFNHNMGEVGKVLNKNINDNIQGLQKVFNGPVPKSGNELLDQINQSFHPKAPKHVALESKAKHALTDTPTVKAKKKAQLDVTLPAEKTQAAAPEVVAPTVVTPAASSAKVPAVKPAVVKPVAANTALKPAVAKSSVVKPAVAKSAVAQPSVAQSAVKPAVSKAATPAVSKTNITKRTAPADPIAAISQQVSASIEQAIKPRTAPNVVRSNTNGKTMQELIPGGRHQTVTAADAKHRAVDDELVGAKHRA